MTTTQPTLLVLAAGMGSRYGGLKQIDPVGPSGEALMDYGIYDALRAGFGRLVYVIRRDFEAEFRRTIGRRFEKQIATEYAFQELDKLPGGFRVPPNRTKPWGTSHAILMARDVIREPFAAINADDFYGRTSFRLLADHLRSGSEDFAMVGFVLRNTLSEHGSVARGVCQLDSNDYLRDVTELTKVERDGRGAKHTDGAGIVHHLSGDENVSMNMWGFTPALFDLLEQLLVEFLKEHGHSEKSEFYIPTAVNLLVNAGQTRLKVLHTTDSWFGVTYKEDRPKVTECIRQLVVRGEYPEKLWA